MEGSKSKPRSDDEVRRDDAERSRSSASNVVDVPARGSGVPSDAPRAESRGIYADGNDRRRVLGAGEPVPDGWRRIEDGDVAARTAEAPGRSSIFADGVEDKAERGPRGR